MEVARVQQEGKNLSTNFYDLYDVESVSGNSEFSESFDDPKDTCFLQHQRREIFRSGNVVKKVFAGGKNLIFHYGRK